MALEAQYPTEAGEQEFVLFRTRDEREVLRLGRWRLIPVGY
jgi:hypothetical protein